MQDVVVGYHPGCIQIINTILGTASSSAYGDDVVLEVIVGSRSKEVGAINNSRRACGLIGNHGVVVPMSIRGTRIVNTVKRTCTVVDIVYEVVENIGWLGRW